MRTKALLIAAAALAVGVVSSQAQVYSQNIVGYVNTPLPSSQYVLIANPLSGTSTNAEAVLTSLQSGDSILFWTGTSYASYLYVDVGSWIYPDGNTVGPAPSVPVGTGFFYLNGQAGNETNTFVGSVVVSNTVTLPSSVYALVGSSPAIGGSLESTNLNLPLQSGDSVLFWTGTSYASYLYVDVGSWIYPDGNTVGPAPSVNVGQGFFYLNGQASAEIWTNSISIQ
jgi:hypothetical protein